MKIRLGTMIFRNLPYKITALILACLFWYMVQGEEVLELNRRIVVNIKAADGYIIKGQETRIKDVTLRGPRVLLGDFSNKPIEATINVTGGRVGQLRYRLDKEFIKGWDNRIKLTIHDPYIVVVVDEKMSKKVPVKEFLKGVPADGHIIEKASIKPEEVVVTGLKSEINRITEVQTEPIDITGLQQTKSFEARLALKDLPESAFSVEKVTVNLLIGEQKINKTFGPIPVQVVGSDYLSSVKPESASITIQGTPGVLSFLNNSGFEIFIEARELEPGKKHTRPIQAKIPENTVLIETVPASATIEIYNQKRIHHH